MPSGPCGFLNPAGTDGLVRYPERLLALTVRVRQVGSSGYITAGRSVVRSVQAAEPGIESQPSTGK